MMKPLAIRKMRFVAFGVFLFNFEIWISTKHIGTTDIFRVKWAGISAILRLWNWPTAASLQSITRNSRLVSTVRCCGRVGNCLESLPAKLTSRDCPGSERPNLAPRFGQKRIIKQALSEARAPAVLVSQAWLWFFPGAVISLVVLAVNFVGDGLRDALDPHSILN